jgi:hypothetical protein
VRVDVTPLRFSAIPGQPALITVQVTNPRPVISGHRLRVLGIDPEWATLDQDTLSLFPDTSGVALVTVTLPEGVPAGVRHLSIEITELTPPGEVAVVDLELTVPAQLGINLSLDPVSLTGGKSATAAVLIENTGNGSSEVELSGTDEDGEVEFRFDPPSPVLGPGQQVLASVLLMAKRPWFGSPKLRTFSVNAGPPRAPVQAFGGWVQRARLSRGALALLGLAAAITIFAVVITASLSQVVNKSNADRDLALAVAQAALNPSTVGTASISGTVTLLSSGAPIGGVTVQLVLSSDTATPLASTATGNAGGYTFSNLAAGTYKVEFSGAGFTQIWYADSLGADSATAITLKAGQKVVGVDVRLGGLPASVSGQVVGANASGATLTLELPPSAPGGLGSVVTTQTLDASGNFSLTGIPSPSVYDIVISLAGYATATQVVDLAAGETRSGMVITLHQGNGSIAGTISTAAGPLGGATISASDGTTTDSSVSLTTPGRVGTFVLSSLETPATFTVVVSAGGYSSQTLSISLAAGQQLTGVAVTLYTGVGSISGSVTTANGAPAGGVTVTASNGQTSVTTVTLSVGTVGSYSLSGLPVPYTYSVTFSRPDLQSQTRAVVLGATGSATSATVGASMVASTASIYGTVTQTGGTPLGEISITLTSGSTTYQSVSASVPTPGAFAIDGIAPGTYTISFARTGGLPTSSIVTLSAGQSLLDNPVLAPAASISGFAYTLPIGAATAVPLQGVEVRLYVASQFPTVLAASTLTASNGSFTFPDVAAPQSYVLAFAYPQGSSAQNSYLVTTAKSTASYICGSTPAGPSASCNSSSASMADPVLVSTQ